MIGGFMMNKTMAAAVISFGALFSSIGSAEIKPDGTVMDRMCGQVEREERPYSIEQSPKTICISSVQGEKSLFITVHPNLGAARVYEVVASSQRLGIQSTHQSSQLKLNFVGIRGPRGLLTEAPAAGLVFETADLVTTFDPNGDDQWVMSLTLQAEKLQTPITATNFELIMHTLSAPSQHQLM